MKRHLPFTGFLLFLFCFIYKAGAQTITAGFAWGNITACQGTASASPNVKQFTVTGGGLTGNITATAPPGFEVSLSPTVGYGGSVSLLPAGGSFSGTVYVRSSATATGAISGNVALTSPGATSVNVPVNGIVSTATVNPVANQTVLNGDATAGIYFSGTANTFTWTNDTPGIGLAASGVDSIPSFTAVNNSNTPITATITFTPIKAGMAYVANDSSKTVSVINTITNTVVGGIGTAGTKPWGVSVSPDGSKVYVSNSGSNTVAVINTMTNNVINVIPVGKTPFGVCVSPDGSKVYVSNYDDATVSVINTATNTVTSTIPVGTFPWGLTVSPDGNRVYVATNPTFSTGAVSVINTTTNMVIASIPVGAAPVVVSVSPDGSRVYATNDLGSNANPTPNIVSVINTATNTVVANITVGVGPEGVTFSPDGSLAYIANTTSNTVMVINATTNSVVANIFIRLGAIGTSITPDGTRLYVANIDSRTVTVINTATNTVIDKIPVGSKPASLGNFITPWVNCSGLPATFTITVNPAPLPVITASGKLAALNTIYGTASSSDSFTVSGTNMRAGILVTPPKGFEVSTDGVNFSSTVTVGDTGTIAATTVYIRLAATTPVGNYSGNIVLSSRAAPGVNLAMPVSIASPAPLIISADNKTKAYGAPNPVLTLTYNGFVNNEGVAQLIFPPVVSTTAALLSPPGTYPIKVSGAYSPDYTITYIPGILTITPDIVVPNAFTPNGDGVNDTWDIKDIANYPNCTVYVFNRYGSKVFSSIGYGIPWDGKDGGANLPQGTYYYIINLQNGIKVLAGSVTIIR